MSSEATRMMSLFNGLHRAYGEYKLPNKKFDNGEKHKGRAQTVKATVTPEVWESHLNGKMGIGVIPIRDDNTCFFAAIDIDSYKDFDILALEEQVRKHEFPVAVCQSKSGGAHVYMFAAEAVPAAKIRSKIKEIAKVLGHPSAEIFPKQDKMLTKDDIGNWINMPYFNAKDTTRFCILDGDKLNLEEFLRYAEDIRLTYEDLISFEITEGEFQDAPPCLEILTSQGFPKGSMNNALFNMGVYARLAHPDEWQIKVLEYNDRFMGPGDKREVQQIIKSLDKKKYTYRCTDMPICNHCNKGLCSCRKFGIASENSPYKDSLKHRKNQRPCILDEVEQPVICYEPSRFNSSDEPYWTFTIGGSQMDVTLDMVTSQMKFLREYLKKYKKMMLPIDEERWATKMNELLSGADVQEMASDAGPEGQLWVHLENFCTGRIKARSQEELAMGKPWTDNGRTYFRSTEFLRYLETQRFKHFSERDIYTILRRNGAKHHKFMIKGKCVASWSIPEFKEQVEEFSKVEPLPEEF